jgi:hypothetical protein
MPCNNSVMAMSEACSALRNLATAGAKSKRLVAKGCIGAVFDCQR